VENVSVTNNGRPIGYPRQESPTNNRFQSSITLPPFLRWAGGKRQIVRELISLLPDDIENRLYREPFLGAGSLFFAIKPERAVLSDANQHLIMCYEFVRDQPLLVARYLRLHASRDSEAYYYKMRFEYNGSQFSAAQAARFIYLNKTCFNGIFRVNSKGQFNVPYGRKESPAIPSQKNLTKIAGVLKKASFRASPFEKALENSSRGEFIYLDPPYPPLNGTAYFTHYTSERFSEQDQANLANCVHGLDKRGCLLMISNADTPLIRRLYKRYKLISLPVIRYLTCKSIRHKVRELVITNYDLPRRRQ
jgi:DNA adenine methylase